MTQFANSKLLAAVCFVLFAGLLAACNKDNDNDNDGTIQLLSFGPTGAKHGDTLRFIGRNLDKVASVQFSGVDAVVDQKEFKQQTNEQILLIVPAAAEKGYVTIKTPGGAIVSKTQLNLNVTVGIIAITAQARPGENITIAGSYLNWVRSVAFAKDIAVTSFVSQSFDQLVVTVPANAQTGPLQIVYAGTDSADFETADTVMVTLPVATGLAPNPAKHADNLTITGTDLDLTAKVLFAGVATPVTDFVSKTATGLVVKVPAGTQKGKVMLEAASGVQTTSGMDLDILLPAVTAMPTNPVTPGSDITLTGTNLDLVDSIAFQNAPAVNTFVSQSATQIVIKVPAGVTEGKLTLYVKNSTIKIQSPDILKIAGAVPPPVLAFPIYNDAVTSNWTSSGWIGGGWGGTKDLENTSPVREGTKSVKIEYAGGYGSPLQLGGASVNIAPYTTFKLSIYGAPGSGGKKINVGINATDKYTITIEEGKWTDYSIPLSSLTSSTILSEIWVKEYNGTGGFSIYVDALGLN